MVLVAAAFAALEAGRGIGEVGANTLVVGRLGAEVLPYLYLPLGVISLVASLAYGAALGRMRRGRLFAAILIGVAVALIAERAAIATAPDVAIPLTWLTVIAAGHHRRDARVDGGDVDIRCAPGQAPLPDLHGRGDRRQLRRRARGRSDRGPGGHGVADRRGGGTADDRGDSSSGGSRRGAPTPAWGPPPAIRRPVVADLRAGFDEVRRAPLARSHRDRLRAARRPALLRHVPVPRGG